ncbi:hypothetical protein FSR19202_BOAJNBJN_00104 [Fructilactobacillus sanfranciscensis]
MRTELPNHTKSYSSKGKVHTGHVAVREKIVLTNKQLQEGLDFQKQMQHLLDEESGSFKRTYINKRTGKEMKYKNGKWSVQSMTFGTIFKVVITLGFLGIGCYFQYLGFLAKRVKQDIETKKKSGEMMSTIDFVNQVNEVSK